MNTFQFYKKLNALVHINVDAPSFHDEVAQLSQHGFERIGDIVQAKTSYAAFNAFRENHFDTLQPFVTSHLFVSSPLQ